MRILLVGDDRMVGAAMMQALKEAAYAVDWVMDGQTAIEVARAQAYDLTLLDLGLPAPSGLEVLREFRKVNRQLPVIIVTARDAVDDRIHGLDLGADDCLVKPFEIRELLARVRAILRRQDSGSSTTLGCGAISLNPATYEVVYEGGTSHLTAREFALLQALILRPGTILSRMALERYISVCNEEVESDAIEVLIHGIRRKLGVSSIREVKGVGWMADRLG